MKTFTRDTTGEPSIWWHWQDLRGDWYSPGKPRVRPTGFCTEGRAWLHIPGNSFQFEWHFGARRFGLTVSFSDQGLSEEAITVSVKIPLVGSFYFSVENAKWVKHLPGVSWKRGQSGDGEREIGFAIHDWAVWLYPWINPMDSAGGSPIAWHIDDFLLGRAKYSDREIETGNYAVAMPEGVYDATYRLFESTWKRPRWPWPKRLLRAEIEVEGGIPVPGKGENSWDCEDTAYFSLIAPATSPEEIASKLRAGVLAKREKYGWDQNGLLEVGP